MRIILIMLIGLMVSNCSNTYVKNKKTITSPDDLQKFVNVYCDKNKSTNKVIKLAEKIGGLRGIDGGKLHNSRYVEDFTALLININKIYFSATISRTISARYKSIW